jgi:hypothetical protein
MIAILFEAARAVTPQAQASQGIRIALPNLRQFGTACWDT